MKLMSKKARAPQEDFCVMHKTAPTAGQAVNSRLQSRCGAGIDRAVGRGQLLSEKPHFFKKIRKIIIPFPFRLCYNVVITREITPGGQFS